jgi:hypothetical protein
VAGWHYNFVKKDKYYVTAEEGMRFFYRQILTGDRADNIQGIKVLATRRQRRCWAAPRQSKSCMPFVWRHWAQREFLKTGGCYG